MRSETCQFKDVCSSEYCELCVCSGCNIPCTWGNNKCELDSK